MTTPDKIPQRTVYNSAEVCAIAGLQPYVLRSWEAEFPDLGVEQAGGRLRLYRRADLDRVLRIKELLFVEGLTLGAARRKILKETPAADAGTDLPLEELLGSDARARVEDVKAGLRSILSILSKSGNGDGTSTSKPAAEGDVAPPTVPTPVAKPARVRKAPRARAKPRRKKA